MLTVDLVDLSNKKEIKEFYNLPFKIYKDIPQWVPPLYTDVRAMMNKKKHPFCGKKLPKINSKPCLIALPYTKV